MKAKQLPKLNNEQIGLFISRIQFSTGCWNWIGRIERGYGTINICNDRFAAHRMSYELFRRETIPLDMTIDHLCRNRVCVNPYHLEVVTLSENVKRASPYFFNNFKTHCINGHAFTKENTYLREGRTPGKYVRHCMECRRQKLRAFRQKIKSASPVMTLNPQ